jgi:hypothetical protein
MVVNRHEPETYADLEALPEYEATKHIFQKAGWEHSSRNLMGMMI